MEMFYYAIYNEMYKCKVWGCLPLYFTGHIEDLMEEIEENGGIAFISDDEKKSAIRCTKFCIF
jgi:hypothetical protein